MISHSKIFLCSGNDVQSCAKIKQLYGPQKSGINGFFCNFVPQWWMLWSLSCSSLVVFSCVRVMWYTPLDTWMMCHTSQYALRCVIWGKARGLRKWKKNSNNVDFRLRGNRARTHTHICYCTIIIIPFLYFKGARKFQIWRSYRLLFLYIHIFLNEKILY